MLVATPKRSLEAAAALARSRGLGVVVLGDNLEGEARELGAAHARQALDIAAKGGKPTVVLSGGETTVTVRGKGRGGRNVEYLLAEAIAANGATGIWGLAADTDGVDGAEESRARSSRPIHWGAPAPRGMTHKRCWTTMTATASSGRWATALSPARPAPTSTTSGQP